MIPQA